MRADEKLAAFVELESAICACANSLDKLARFFRNSPGMKTSISSVLIAFLLACFALSLRAQAVVPPPDGCYPAFTTAEGCNALAGLGSGLGNTGLGWYSLFSAGDANYNTGVGAGTLALTSGADSNTAVGTAAMLLNVNGPANTAVGANALVYNDNGGGNTANGAFALFGNTTGSFNVAIGWDALPNNDNGSGNVAIGEESLVNNISGGDNTVLGAGAGANIQAGSNNVYIGSGVDANGPFDESDTIRIGAQGTQTATYIAGIHGFDASAGVPVYILPTGQLGTVPSSRPVSSTGPGTTSALQELKAIVAEQQKQIEALTAGLQKVSAQLELSKAAPQTVLNND